MERIRYDLQTFVRYWNSHRIRAQPRRSHVVAGKPWALYQGSDPSQSFDCRVSLVMSTWEQVRAILDTDPYDPNVYLLQEMMILCNIMMSDFVSVVPNAVDRPLKQEYLFLSRRLRVYDRSKESPQLCLIPHLINGGARLREILAELGADFEAFNTIEPDNEDWLEDGLM